MCPTLALSDAVDLRGGNGEKFRDFRSRNFLGQKPLNGAHIIFCDLCIAVLRSLACAAYRGLVFIRKRLAQPSGSGRLNRVRFFGLPLRAALSF